MRINHESTASRPRGDQRKQDAAVERFLDLLARLIAREHLRRTGSGDDVDSRVGTESQPGRKRAGDTTSASPQAGD